ISGTASTGQIPNLSALKITSGQLALAQGGTGADLSATGGTSQVLKQTSVGGAVSVAQLAFTDISGTAGLTQGGTGVDLSASGGSGFVLKQNASHVISAAALVAGDIPSLDASKITTGTLSASLLPFPGLSTLGGILELVPVSHQWVNQITSTGVPLT